MCPSHFHWSRSQFLSIEIVALEIAITTQSRAFEWAFSKRFDNGRKQSEMCVCNRIIHWITNEKLYCLMVIRSLLFDAYIRSIHWGNHPFKLNAQSGSECDFGPFGVSSVSFDSFKYMYCEIINRNMMNKRDKKPWSSRMNAVRCVEKCRMNRENGEKKYNTQHTFNEIHI